MPIGAIMSPLGGWSSSNPSHGLKDIVIERNHDTMLWAPRITGQTTIFDVEEANRRVKELNRRD